MCLINKTMRQSKPLKAAFSSENPAYPPCREQRNQKNAPAKCLIMFPVHLDSGQTEQDGNTALSCISLSITVCESLNCTLVSP